MQAHLEGFMRKVVDGWKKIQRLAPIYVCELFRDLARRFFSSTFESFSAPAHVSNYFLFFCIQQALKKFNKIEMAQLKEERQGQIESLKTKDEALVTMQKAKVHCSLDPFLHSKNL